MIRRREDDRITREYTQAIAYFLRVQAELDAYLAANDEPAYNACYESKFQPYYDLTRRSIGAELAGAAVRKAQA